RSGWRCRGARRASGPRSCRRTGRPWSRVLLDDDRPLGAVQDGLAGLVLVAGGDDAAVQLDAVADLVRLEELRRQAVAAAVPLADVLVDVDPHGVPSGIG